MSNVVPFNFKFGCAYSKVSSQADLNKCEVCIQQPYLCLTEEKLDCKLPISKEQRQCKSTLS